MLKLLIIIVLCVGCVNNNKTPDVTENTIEELTAESISPLQSGVFECKEADFGDIIELKGESRPVDEIFKVSETEILIKDGLRI